MSQISNVSYTNVTTTGINRIVIGFHGDEQHEVFRLTEDQGRELMFALQRQLQHAVKLRMDEESRIEEQG